MDNVTINDLIKIKDEMFMELHNLDEKMDTTISDLVQSVQSQISPFDDKIKSLETKIDYVSNQDLSTKSLLDKIPTLVDFKEKTSEDLTKLQNAAAINSKDIDNMESKYGKIIKDNILIPNLVGPNCKYLTLKNFIEKTESSLNVFTQFKEKSSKDSKTQKDKLEKLISQFSTQIHTSQTNFQEYVRKALIENDLKIEDKFKSVDEKFDLMRLENGKYSKDLLEQSKSISIDWEKVQNIREEIYTKFDENLKEFKDQQQAVHQVVSDFSSEFKFFKKKFTELSEFIKDVRFRRGLFAEGAKRKDFLQMGDNIDFNKKKNKNFQKEEDEESDFEELLAKAKAETTSKGRKEKVHGTVSVTCSPKKIIAVTPRKASVPEFKSFPKFPPTKMSPKKEPELPNQIPEEPNAYDEKFKDIKENYNKMLNEIEKNEEPNPKEKEILHLEEEEEESKVKDEDEEKKGDKTIVLQKMNKSIESINNNQHKKIALEPPKPKPKEGESPKPKRPKNLSIFPKKVKVENKDKSEPLKSQVDSGDSSKKTVMTKEEKQILNNIENKMKGKADIVSRNVEPPSSSYFSEEEKIKMVPNKNKIVKLPKLGIPKPNFAHLMKQNTVIINLKSKSTEPRREIEGDEGCDSEISHVIKQKKKELKTFGLTSISISKESKADKMISTNPDEPPTPFFMTSTPNIELNEINQKLIITENRISLLERSINELGRKLTTLIKNKLSNIPSLLNLQQNFNRSSTKFYKPPKVQLITERNFTAEEGSKSYRTFNLESKKSEKKKFKLSNNSKDNPNPMLMFSEDSQTNKRGGFWSKNHISDLLFSSPFREHSTSENVKILNKVEPYLNNKFMGTVNSVNNINTNNTNE